MSKSHWYQVKIFLNIPSSPGRFSFRPAAQLSSWRSFSTKLGIPPVFLQDWLPYFLDIIPSSFLVYSRVWVDTFSRSFLWLKDGSTATGMVLTAPISLSSESCCFHLDGCPLQLNYELSTPQSLFWGFSPLLDTLFSILHIFLDWILLPLFCCFNFFLSILLRYNWQTTPYKFKAYSIMIWLTYVMKWLSR